MRRRSHRLGVGLLAVLVAAVGVVSCSILSPPKRESRHLYGIGVVWANWLTSSEIPAQYQGDPGSYNRAQLDAIVAAGGDATHVSFDWAVIEPTRGTYDWTLADAMVKEVVSDGLTAFAYIGNTPSWATPPNGLPGYRTPPDETYAADFMQYAEAVARRYRGKVDHFLFWNEPNGCSWINDGCSNGDGYALYTKWLKRAYTALKKGNPDCVVGAGSLDYGSYVPAGYTYIEGMYQSGAKGYFDAIDIHPYDDTGLHWQAIDDTRRVMVEHGDGSKAVWISEYGWKDSSAADAANRLTATLQRLSAPDYRYVTYAQYLVLSDLPNTTQYGLMDRDLVPRPAYTAFKDFPKDEGGG